MFTGIVEETGVVELIKPAAKSIELTIRTKVCGRGLKLGASLAVNGCCLTVVKVSSPGAYRRARFDLFNETWKRTNLQYDHPGSLVNLERPPPPARSPGAHFSTWHIPQVCNINPS